MRLSASTILLGALPLLLTSGCSRDASPTAQAASGTSSGSAGAPGDALAVVNGKPITRAQVDEKAAGELFDVRQKEYEARKRALDKLVSDALLDKEAAARGVTRDALIKAEVTDKVPPPSPQEVDRIWEINKYRFPGRPKEEFVPQIVDSVLQQGRAQKDLEFRSSLRDKAQVQIALKPPRTTVNIPAGSHSLGPDSAKVTVVEYLDYQCPYCQRAESTVEMMMDRYKGQVRLVALDFPIPGQARALPAARAAHCAGEQQKFWDYHKALLAQPSDFSDPDLKTRAQKIGLEMNSFSACLASDKHDSAINKTAEDGAALGVSATPTFFVNGLRMVGGQDISEFARLIEDELKGS